MDNRMEREPNGILEIMAKLIIFTLMVKAGWNSNPLIGHLPIVKSNYPNYKPNYLI